MPLCCTNVYRGGEARVDYSFSTIGASWLDRDVVASGKFPKWPTNVWSSHDSIRWECQNEPGKLQAIISPDAPLGLHWIRIYNEAGSSGTKPFLIGSHPGSVEKEPNNFVSQANASKIIPASVNGILSQRGDVDLFRWSSEKNQALAVSVESAKWLQTPADISLQILDAKVLYWQRTSTTWDWIHM